MKTTVACFFLFFVFAMPALAWNEPLREDSRNAQWPVCRDQRHQLNPSCGGALSLNVAQDTEDRATQLFRDRSDQISSCNFSDNSCRIYDQAQTMVAMDLLSRTREIVFKAQQDILKSVRLYKQCLARLPADSVRCPEHTDIHSLSETERCACVRDQLPVLTQKFHQMRAFRSIASSGEIARTVTQGPVPYGATSLAAGQSTNLSTCAKQVEGVPVCAGGGASYGCAPSPGFDAMLAAGDSCLVNRQVQHERSWIERNFGGGAVDMQPLNDFEVSATQQIYRSFRERSPQLSGADLSNGINELKQTAQREYQALVIDHPIFNYLAGPSPSPQEFVQAFTQVEQNLTAEITRIRGEKDLGEYLRYDAAIQQAISEVNARDPQSTGNYCEVVNRMYREDEGWRMASQIGIAGLGLMTFGAGTAIGVAAVAATEAYQGYRTLAEYNTQAAVCRSGGEAGGGTLCSADRLTAARDQLYAPSEVALAAAGIVSVRGAARTVGSVERGAADTLNITRPAAWLPGQPVLDDSRRTFSRGIASYFRSESAGYRNQLQRGNGQAAFLNRVGFSYADTAAQPGMDQVLLRTNELIDDQIRAGQIVRGQEIRPAVVMERRRPDGSYEQRAFLYGEDIPEGFALPRSGVIQADQFARFVAEGRYPVGTAGSRVEYGENLFLHDMAHVGGFYDNPRYAAEIRRQFQDVVRRREVVAGRPIEASINYVMESAVVPDAARAQEFVGITERFGFSRRGADQAIGIDAYRERLRNMSEQDLARLHTELQNANLLRDLGGGERMVRKNLSAAGRGYEDGYNESPLLFLEAFEPQNAAMRSADIPVLGNLSGTVTEQRRELLARYLVAVDSGRNIDPVNLVRAGFRRNARLNPRSADDRELYNYYCASGAFSRESNVYVIFCP